MKRAAEALAGAQALLVTAGAGMGVDSGLPDFRGPQGFWRAYPAYGKLGLEFEALAQPRWFERDPALAWGFYGHRLALYRRTQPHEGFAILRRWAARMAHGMAVFTSNVDGQFQRAGVEIVSEVHGAIEWLQCTRCRASPWLAPPEEVEVDLETGRAREPWPLCACGSVARPNILMFNDGGWDPERSDAQQDRLDRWLAAATDLVIVECGAGTAIPSVRRFGEHLVRGVGAQLIRVNPREPDVPVGQISIAAGAMPALRAIDEAA